MRYEEAIEKLNTASAEELSEKLEKLENRANLSEEAVNSILSETVGMAENRLIITKKRFLRKLRFSAKNISVSAMIR